MADEFSDSKKFPALQARDPIPKPEMPCFGCSMITTYGQDKLQNRERVHRFEAQKCADGPEARTGCDPQGCTAGGGTDLVPDTHVQNEWLAGSVFRRLEGTLLALSLRRRAGGGVQEGTCRLRNEQRHYPLPALRAGAGEVDQTHRKIPGAAAHGS